MGGWIQGFGQNRKNMNGSEKDTTYQRQLIDLSSEHGEVSLGARYFWVQQGKAAVPFLLNVLETDATDWRLEKVIETLGLIGDSAAVSKLTPFLEREILSWQTALAIARIGSEEALSILNQRINSEHNIAVKEAIRVSGITQQKPCIKLIRTRHCHI